MMHVARPLTPEFRKQGQADLCLFEANLIYEAALHTENSSSQYIFAGGGEFAYRHIGAMEPRDIGSSESWYFCAGKSVLNSFQDLHILSVNVPSLQPPTSILNLPPRSLP